MNIQDRTAYDLMKDSLAKQRDFFYEGRAYRFVTIEDDSLLLADSDGREEKVPFNKIRLLLLLS